MSKTSLSLKALIPSFAQALDVSSAALYERQRALVRAGLLKSEPGRGPGSGVRATPHSVAMLLISLIATPSLSEVGACTRTVANLKSNFGLCPLTGQRTFAGALTAILTDETLAERVDHVQAERGGTEYDATIVFEEELSVGGKFFPNSTFGKGKSSRSLLCTQTYLALDFEALATVLHDSEAIAKERKK